MLNHQLPTIPLLKSLVAVVSGGAESGKAGMPACGVGLSAAAAAAQANTWWRLGVHVCSSAD
jgi:hypothetical protein